MEDRYLFKAKRVDNGEWVTGSLITCEDGTCKIATSCLEGKADEPILVCAYDVDRDTICQCTGLKDKNGNLIWENDIVRTIYDGIEHIYQVIWDKSELDFKATNGKEFYKSNFEYLPCCDEVEVIGNIFDNPELLESEE